jgi:glycosyltransferase involved in cell wall biosynthesis
MRVLQVHNFYQQPGGEDQVFAAEYEMLTAQGHAVKQYSEHNDSLHGIANWRMAGRALWNAQTYRSIHRLIEAESIELVHAHNTFPVISPSLFYATHAANVPVVQTLHNYRLLCPAATFFRDGSVCENCLGSRVPYHSIVHRCYRGSIGASATATAMLAAHWAAGTWSSKIDAYIALTTFSKNKFVEGGLPAGRIHVKPGFLPVDPGIGRGDGGYALFIGRLIEEKGIDLLCRTWSTLGSTIPLKIAGDGPLRPTIQGLSRVEYLGQCERPRLIELLKQAAFLVVPSLWYEGFPMVIVEALACGTPVIASALGSMNELVENGVTGFRFAPGDADALLRCVENALQSGRLTCMRARTRACYEQNYTAERNYNILMDIYSAAKQRSSKKRPSK